MFNESQMPIDFGPNLPPEVHETTEAAENHESKLKELERRAIMAIKRICPHEKWEDFHMVIPEGSSEEEALAGGSVMVRIPPDIDKFKPEERLFLVSFKDGSDPEIRELYPEKPKAKGSKNMYN